MFRGLPLFSGGIPNPFSIRIVSQLYEKVNSVVVVQYSNYYDVEHM